MKGFYKRQEVVVPKKKKRNIAVRRGGCESCKAYAHCENGKFPISGNGSNGIMIVDGGVSTQEEQTGVPFSGITQKYLAAKLRKLGVDLADCWYVHSIRCHTERDPKTGKPKVNTLMKNGCTYLLKEDIKRLKPRKIILLGDEAVAAVYGERATISRIGGGHAERYYGHCIPDQETECYVFPNYSPEFVLEAIGRRKKSLDRWRRYRKENGPLWEHSLLKMDDNFRIRDLYFKQYLKQAIKWKKPWCRVDYRDYCNSVETVEEAIAIMKSLNKPGRLSIDIETNCLKPYADTSKIYTVAIADDNVANGFSWYNNEDYKKALRDLLINPNIEWEIANVGMEFAWFYVFLGVEIANVNWDTVVASHFINPTVKKGNSLKFCTLKYEGECGYDAGVHEFIMSKGDNKPQYDLNRIHLIPAKDRNIYCAADVFYTKRVAKRQRAFFENEPQMFELFKVYMKGTVLFSKTSIRGFNVDEIALLTNIDKAEREMYRVESLIAKCDEVLDWDYEFPDKPFKVTSPDHLREMFFDFLGFDTSRRTKGGKKSTDSDVIEAISEHSELARLIMKRNVQEKITEVLTGIKKNTMKGKIHPEILLFTASTGRSSSQNPGFQNLPLHNPVYSEAIRSVLTAPPGKEIIDGDFKALEKRLAYTVHQDPVFLAELQGADSHAATAEYIFLDNEKATRRIAEIVYPEKLDFTEDELEAVFEKWVRKEAKGPGFAMQFGCAPERLYSTLWLENFKAPHKQYFKEIGLGTESAFKKHSQQVFDAYWERFKVQKQWREDVWEEYLSKGYIYSKAGWRMNGICSKNLIGNALIQGLGLYVTLLAGLKLEEDLRGYKSKYILSIHDAHYIAADPEEWANGGVKEIFQNAMSTYVNDEIDWMLFPMDVGFEYSLGNWHNIVKEDKLKEAYGLET